MSVYADPVEIDGYGRVARAIHWLIAAPAVIVVALGLAIPGAQRETAPRG